MILVRAPLRISFVGGGTDLAEFYQHYPGRVLSSTIDKFIYLAVKPTHLVNKFIVKYQTIESVAHPKELEHLRVRETLLDLGITSGGIEIASFADIPAKTGLGSSSSFSTALIKGLHAFLGRQISKEDLAEAACRLEIELLGEPIGKQDQYVAAFGGFNIFEFQADGSVSVEPILLDFKKRRLLEQNILLFFTGVTRDASSVLGRQRTAVEQNLEVYKQMSDSVLEFKELLLQGDIFGMAEMLHEGWERKKSLASNMTSSSIDEMYTVGRQSGALGGKILGAGGGGCLLFIAPREKHDNIRQSMNSLAAINKLDDFQEIPVSFTQSGTDILFNNHYPESV